VKVAIIFAVVVVAAAILYFAVVSPAMRSAGEKSALESIMSAKSDIPQGTKVTPDRVGSFSITQTIPPKAPLSIEIRDAAVTYTGPGGEIRFYYARTTEWGREPVDHPGVMQSTSRALADYASGPLLRLDVPGHPIVRAQLKNGGWCACWMNLDNLFCAVADDKEQLSAFVSAYPY
jgi:hypothetical protein